MAIVARLKGSYPVQVEGVSPIHVTRTNGVDQITLTASEIDSSEITVDPDNIVGLSATSLAALNADDWYELTSGATYTVAETLPGLKLNKASVTTITLPDTSARDGLPLVVVDSGRAAHLYNHTIVAATGETIMGGASLKLTHAGQSVCLVPDTANNNWIIWTENRRGDQLPTNWIVNGDVSAWATRPGTGTVTATAGAPFAAGVLPDGCSGGPGGGGEVVFSRGEFTHTQTDVTGYPRYYGKLIWNTAPTSGSPTEYTTADRMTVWEQNYNDAVERAWNKVGVYSFWARVPSGTLDVVPIVTMSMGTLSWLTGQTKVAGDYVVNTASDGNLRVYYTAAGGTTGATQPTHTTGTVSDGGVSWQHIGLAKGRVYDNYESGPNSYLGTVYPTTTAGTPGTGAACSLTTTWQYFTRIIALPGPGYTATYTGADTSRTLISPTERLEWGGALPSVQFGIDTINGQTKFTAGNGFHFANLKYEEGIVATPFEIAPRRLNETLSSDFKQRLSSVTGDATATGLITNTGYGSQAMRTLTAGDSSITVTNGSGAAGNPTVVVATNGVGDTKLRQGTSLSVIGRSANSPGNVADITGGTNQVLRVSSGNVLGFGSIDLSASGTVGSSVLAAANGGTGQSSYTAGNILYASGASALSKLAPGTSSQVLVGGTTPSWGSVPVAAGGSETTMTSFTPTMTPGSGSFTTTTGISGYYVKLGPKLVWCSMQGTVTNIGTGSGAVRFTLPFTATSNHDHAVLGREPAVAGKLLTGNISPGGTTVDLYFDNNVSPIANNAKFIVTFAFDIS